MLRAVLLSLFLVPAAAGSSRAACAGTDLIPGLPAADRAAIAAAIDAAPHARGLFWRATRGDETVHLLGTYHLDDPRADALVAPVLPVIDTAKLVLVEARTEEIDRLQRELSSRPELVFALDAPSLPEELGPEGWKTLSVALDRRGVPPFSAVKMQPWLISVMLALPPCAMIDMAQGQRGIDMRVMERAEAAGIPLRALEPYDAVVRAMDALPRDTLIGMVRSGLATEPQAEDYLATTTAAYFAEEPFAAWEFYRRIVSRAPGATDEESDRLLAAFNEALVAGRNRNWLEIIEPAAAGGPVFVAVGALHLPGEEGLIALLAKAGFAVERLPL